MLHFYSFNGLGSVIMTQDCIYMCKCTYLTLDTDINNEYRALQSKPCMWQFLAIYDLCMPRGIKSKVILKI